MKREEQTVSKELTDYQTNGFKGVKTMTLSVPDTTTYTGPVVGTVTEISAEDYEITKAKN